MNTVTEREVPLEIPDEGGFPSLEEFQAVCKVLADAEEFGLTPLFRRINTPLVEAYEAGEEATVPYTYENIGVLAAKTEDLEYWVSELVEKVTQLKALIGDLADAISDRGRVMNSPKFGRYGNKYEPSKEALGRWGLAKVK